MISYHEDLLANVKSVKSPVIGQKFFNEQEKYCNDRNFNNIVRIIKPNLENWCYGKYFDICILEQISVWFEIFHGT